MCRKDRPCDLLLCVCKGAVICLCLNYRFHGEHLCCSLGALLSSQIQAETGALKASSRGRRGEEKVTSPCGNSLLLCNAMGISTAETNERQ